MSTAPQSESTPPPPPPTIHEAERASGTSGAVLYGPEIDFAVAVARRRADREPRSGDSIRPGLSVSKRTCELRGTYRPGYGPEPRPCLLELPRTAFRSARRAPVGCWHGTRCAGLSRRPRHSIRWHAACFLVGRCPPLRPNAAAMRGTLDVGYIARPVASSVEGSRGSREVASWVSGIARAAGPPGHL